jgi:predicted GNAT family N-acyltransferase
MGIIRFLVEVLRLFTCAAIVFLAYAKMGYYPWYKATSAIGSYYKEKKKLNACVLVEHIWGFLPIGTIMCSIDSGWLPIDELFPMQMEAIRQEGVRLGYFGKFAVTPNMRGKQAGQRLIMQARKWTIEQHLDQAVILVNPKHVPYYLKMGFHKVDWIISVGDLKNAPAVLLSINNEDFQG